MKNIFRKLILFFSISVAAWTQVYGQCEPNILKFQGGQPIYNTACENKSYQDLVGDLNPSGSGLTYRWEYSFSGAPFTTVVNGSNVPISTSKLSKNDITDFVLAPNLDASGDYSLRRIVSSGTCSNTSAAVFLYYSQNISRISGGAVSNQEKCSPASGSLIVTGNTGPVLRWESAPAGTQNWTLLDSTRNSLSYNNLTQSTCYRALIDNICTGTPGVIDASDIYSTPGCVTVNSAPLVSAPLSQTLCPGSALNLSVTVTSILTPSYQWKKNGVNINGATSASFNIPAVDAADAGSYDIVVSNDCGSVTSDAAVITISPLPAVVVPGSSTVCAGATIPASSFNSTPAGATYTWTNSNTAIGLAASGTGDVPAFTALNSGTTTISSTITVTPVLNGCAGPSSSYIITVKPLPAAIVPSSFSVCSGATVSSSSFSSLPAGATYTWTSSNPSVGLDASGSNNVPSFIAVNNTASPITTTISVTPSINGCTGPASSYTITVNPLPVITSATPQQETTCDESDGKITIIAEGATPLEYSINGGSTFQGLNLFEDLAAGSYTVAVRNANGCIVVGQTVTVTSPGAPAAPVVNSYQYPVCEGSNLVLSVQNPDNSFVYSWTGPSQFSGSGTTVTIPNVSPSMAGSYAVTATSDACVGLPTVFNVAVSPLPVVTVPPNLTFCAGATIPEGVFISTPAGATYSWTNSRPEIGLVISGNNNVPSFTAINTTTLPITATITVTPTLNGCPGPSKTFTITVNPLPAVVVPVSFSVCVGSSVTSSGFSSNISGTTYTWTNSNSAIGLPSNGSGDVPVFTAVNNSTSPILSTITVTPFSNGCAGTPLSYTITVNPLPEVTVPINSSVCAGTSIPASSFSSIPPNATYTWTNSNTAIGLAASGSGNISGFTATNSSSATIIATITVTPLLNGCTGPSSIYTITVNPLPAVTVPAGFSACSGSNIPATSFSSAPAGASYTWTNSNTGIGLAASGIGNITSFTAINTGSSSISGTITVTPSINGCTGPSSSYTITVNPLPSVSGPASFAICSGATVPSSNFSSSITGTNYSWTNSNTAIGLAASGNGDISAFTATNPSTSTISATITVTPVLNGCTGSSSSYTIIVNPLPAVNVPANSTVCPGTTIPASSFSSTPTGATYTWTNSNTAIGLAASGSGNVQSFTASNTTASPITATITVTPVLNGCTGPSSSYIITVNPLPAVNALANSTVCAGTPVPASSFSSTPAGATYTWTNSNTAIGLAASGIGNVTGFTAVNNTTSPIFATITVTPSLNDCAGPPESYTITVNPLPAVTVPANFTVCAGTTIPLAAFSSNLAGTSFNWTNSNTAIGLSASGSGSVQSFTAINNTTSPITSTITVTPSLNDCAGPPESYTITVNPLPAVNVPANSTVCSGATIPASSFSSTPTGATNSWTNSNTAIGLAASGNGDISAFTAANSSTSTISATITVTPMLNGCTGPASSYTITVNPLPAVNVPANSTVCPGTTIPASSFSSTPTGATYFWTNSNTAIGLAASGNGDISAFTATNSSTSTISATITVTPVLNGCTGSSSSYTITVNPLPVVNVPASFSVCSGATIPPSSFSSTPSGALYTWTNSNTAIGLSASGSGNVPGITASNNTTSPITATITVTPTLNGCTGPASTYTITINPLPSVSGPASSTVCAGTTIPSTNFTSNITGTSYSWTNSNTAIGLAASGTGNIPSFTATNSTAFGISAIITVTPALNGCAGPSISYTITVNPLPVITTATATAESQCNINDGTITITATGTQPLEFSINGGSTFVQNGGNFTGLAAGSYSVVVRNASGCIITGPTLSVSSPGAPPQPDINAYVSPVCQGEPLILSILNPNPLATYRWTGPLGFTDTGSTVIRSNSDPSMSGSYAVTATVSSCVSVSRIFDITVSPLPALIVPQNLTYCKGSTVPESIFNSTPPGATITWTNSNPEIGLAAGGNGNIPAFTAVNNTASPITATITLIPTLNNCTGQSYTYTITVNPLPLISGPLSSAVCTGATISATNFSSSLPGTSYSWTNSNTAIGLAASGTGNIPSFIAANPTSLGISAVITVNPTLNGCAGPSISYTITVNPLPTITAASATNESQCNFNDGTITITASGIQPLEYSINGGSTFVQNGGSFTGLAAGSYSVVVRNASGCLFIGPALSVSSPGAPPQPDINAYVSPVCQGVTLILSIQNPDPLATYTWTGPLGFTGKGATITRPNSDPSMSGSYAVTATLNSCVSVSKIFNITVSPLPTVIVPSNLSYCHGGTIPESIFNSTPQGAGITWTNSNPGIGLATSGNGSIPAFTAVNNSTTPITASITVTPALNNCTGPSSTYTITINPLPAVTVPGNFGLCAGTVISASIFSSNIPGVNYTWTNSNTSIGLAANGSGNVPGFTSLNNTTSSKTAIITVTPTLNGCAEPSSSYSITVKPQPKVSNVVLTQAICTGSNSKSVALTSNIPGTTFTWTATAGTNLQGYTRSGTSTIPVQLITNNSSNAGTITYTIIPFHDGCAGPATEYTIVVHPLATATLSGGKTACYGATTTLSVNLTGVAPWTITYTDGVTPVTINGIGTSTYTFNVTSNSTRTYTITSLTDALSCSNTGTGSAIVVQPAAAIIATGSFSNITCYGSNNGSIRIETVSGGFGIYEYSINRGQSWQNSTSFGGLSPGTYQLYVRDAAHPECITVVSPDYTITQPAAPISLSFTRSDVSCFGGRNGSIKITVAGGTAPYTYSWSGGQTSKDINGLTTGVYTVSITDSKGCVYTEPISIRQPAAPLRISFIKSDATCFGNQDGSIDISVTGGTLPYTYKWSDNESTEDRRNLAPNISYSVTVIDANGCTETQIITINQPEVLKASLTVKNTSCKTSIDGTITASITGGTQPYTLSWAGLPFTGNTISDLAPGNYELLVRDAKGCSITVTAEVIAGNCPPVAVDDRFSTDEEVPVSGSVALNDFDRQGEAISFTQASIPKNGRITFAGDGQFTYTPNVGFWGIETITYRVCNTSGMCATATLIIEVIPFTIVNLKPALSNVREGKKAVVTAWLMRPFKDDVIIRLSYKGRALKDRDYVLLDQFQDLRIPRGKISTSEKITLAALTDDLQEGDEDVIIDIAATSDPRVRIGTGAIVIINDVYPPENSIPVTTETPLNPDITPDPLVSPNDDGMGNDFFKIENIVSFPDNLVLIFNRWGNEVFRLKGYNESDRVFKGYANTGLLTKQNTPLVDGVYYYLITTNRIINGKNISALNKGYLILKR